MISVFSSGYYIVVGKMGGGRKTENLEETHLNTRKTCETSHSELKFPESSAAYKHGHQELQHTAITNTLMFTFTWLLIAHT